METDIAVEVASRDTFYLGHPEFSERVLLWTPGTTASGLEDILVGEDGGPAILSGLFTILPDRFGLNPEAGFEVGRLPISQERLGPYGAFAAGKASALLAPVPSLLGEYAQYDASLLRLMEMAPGKRDQDMGFRLQRDGLPVYRVQFDIFEGRYAPDHVISDLPFPIPDNPKVPDDDVPVPFRIFNWPVRTECLRYLRAIVPTHRAVPIPAVRYGSEDLIEPADYTRLLCGAIVHMHFTLSHKDLRRDLPISYFTATIHKIVVLQEHVPADVDM